MFRASRSIVATTSNSVVKRATMQKRTFLGLFADKNAEIVGDADQQSGRRKVEMDMAAQGITAYNREPIIPKPDAGTKENPIIVLSGEHHRTVGYECPIVHQMQWFNLWEGNVHYLPDINLYFKLEKVGSDEAH